MYDHLIMKENKIAIVTGGNRVSVLESQNLLLMPATLLLLEQDKTLS